ncbi:unnamed protein product [Brassica napus]|uniref:(rape) hypothetical protein n=1 Tax=Brassica napus TaxID=3708 RepID=A0A816UTB5_BRANA|nr:unnamed protein product [Brassica napus]
MSQGCDLSVLEELTSNAKQIQDDVLNKILKANANTEYLSRFLEGSSDKELFKKNVPVVSYEDVKPYIDRVANGEPSDIISGEPITTFNRSSGTSSGNQKIYPANNIYFENQLFGYALSSAVMSKHVDGYKQGKAMVFSFTHRISTTLCGLPRNEVVRVGATFPSVLVRVINFLEKYWKELASNIRSGTVSDWITDLSCRDSVSTILGEPNAELADLIEHECGGQKSWQGIITRLWPKTKYIETIVTGTMSQHIPALDYYSNKLPLVSKVYASSEAFFGMNVNPLSKPQHVSYTFLPNMSYFEFVEVDDDGGTTGEIVDLVNVKLGSYYELLVTNFSGLHRCRVGDVLQVTGFYNNTPQFRFVRRKNTVLCVDVEPTTEEDISKALARATVVLESSDLILTGFTCFGDISTVPGHYVFYVELKATVNSGTTVLQLDNKVLVDYCCVVEESMSSLYRRLRVKDGPIGPLELRVVQQGTFDSLMEFFVARGSSISQYKTPMCINSAEALKVLEDKVLARFFSDKSPPI